MTTLERQRLLDELEEAAVRFTFAGEPSTAELEQAARALRRYHERESVKRFTYRGDDFEIRDSIRRVSTL